MSSHVNCMRNELFLNDISYSKCRVISYGAMKTGSYRIIYNAMLIYVESERQVSAVKLVTLFYTKKRIHSHDTGCHIKWISLRKKKHYCDVIMGPTASQITSTTSVYSIVYSGTDQRKHQSSATLAFVRGIHRGPVNSPHKWPATRKRFPCDDVIMKHDCCSMPYILWWYTDIIASVHCCPPYTPSPRVWLLMFWCLVALAFYNDDGCEYIVTQKPQKSETCRTHCNWWDRPLSDSSLVSFQNKDVILKAYGSTLKIRRSL